MTTTTTTTTTTPTQLVFTDVKKLVFKGTGKISIDKDGKISGAEEHEFSDGKLVLVPEGGGGSASTTVTNGSSIIRSGGSISNVDQGNVVLGSVFAGGSTFVGDGVSSTGGSTEISNGRVKFGDGTRVKQKKWGLEVTIGQSKQIEINGKRYAVADLRDGTAATPVTVTRPPTIEMSIGTGNIKRITVGGGCKVEIDRFPALSRDSLDVAASGNATLTFARNFAVKTLNVDASGNVSVSAVETLSVRDSKLSASGNAKISEVCCAGHCDASSSGNAVIDAYVVDKNEAETDHSGNSRCRVIRMSPFMVDMVLFSLQKLDADGEEKTAVDDDVRGSPKKRKKI
jgi:hypothetical protein